MNGIRFIFTRPCRPMFVSWPFRPPPIFAVAVLSGLLLGIPSAAAQTSTLVGTVRDADTLEPLPGAHVFIAQTMRGTATDSLGRFRLPDVAPGAKRLYVSMLGYVAASYDLLLPGDAPAAFDVRLKPTVLQGEEVIVQAERDAGWYKSLRRFERGFVGESDFAQECELLNPEVLRFDASWWRGLRADAVGPLVLVNRALGYRVTYYLEEFEHRGSVIRWDGEPLFEELTPADSIEAATWAANRRAAYYGSLRHFLLALLNNRVREEGFRMHRLPRSAVRSGLTSAPRFRATRDRMLTPGPDSTHQLDFNGRLEVIYEGERESRGFLRWSGTPHRRQSALQHSYIRLNDPPIHVDRFGEIVEPYGATVYDYFAFEMRLSMLLPLGYTPNDDSP